MGIGSRKRPCALRGVAVIRGPRPTKAGERASYPPSLAVALLCDASTPL